MIVIQILIYLSIWLVAAKYVVALEKSSSTIDISGTKLSSMITLIVAGG